MEAYQLVCLVFLSSVGLISAQTKIWSLALGHDWGAHEYIDTDGYIKGYGYEIAEAVCKEAQMDCRMIWDKYKNCWGSDPLSHASPGRGLMARWYDGCMGWVPTVERIHSISITQPYLKETVSMFYYKKGTSFDPSNLRGKTIGFLDGWANDKACVARQNIQNNKSPNYTINVQDNPEDMLPLILDGTVDAMFGAEDNWNPKQREQLEATRQTYKCFLGGNGIMARKDSPFIAAWNVGFSKLKDSNKYSKLCKEWQQKHIGKGEVQCEI